MVFSASLVRGRSVRKDHDDGRQEGAGQSLESRGPSPRSRRNGHEAALRPLEENARGYLTLKELLGRVATKTGDFDALLTTKIRAERTALSAG